MAKLRGSGAPDYVPGVHSGIPEFPCATYLIGAGKVYEIKALDLHSHRAVVTRVPRQDAGAILEAFADATAFVDDEYYCI